MKKILIKKMLTYQSKILKKILFTQIIENKENTLPISDFEKLILFSNSLKIEDKIRFWFLYQSDVNNILMKNNKILRINNINQEFTLSLLFYLYILIINNNEIINYSFSINFLIELNQYAEINIDSKDILKRIIFAKIIFDLIDYFLEMEEIDEETENRLQQIKIFNLEVIKNLFENINDELIILFDLNKIFEKKIDDIIIEIIKTLIINADFKNFNVICNILNQLDLSKLIPTKKLINQFPKLLNEDENYLKQYKISKTSDLFIEEKINFYYFFIKYIIKDPIYIYKIPFLLNTRKYLKKVLFNPKKLNDLLNYNFENIKTKKRMEYILKKIIDSDYYYMKYFQIIINKLEIIIKYYEIKHFNEQINSIKDIIKKKEGYYEKFLEDYEEAKILDKKLAIFKEELKGINIQPAENLLFFFGRHYKISINDLNICYYFGLLYNIIENSLFALSINNNSFSYDIIYINDIIFNKKIITYKKLFDMTKNETLQNHYVHFKLILNLNKIFLFFNELGKEIKNEIKINKLSLIFQLKREFSEKEYIYNISLNYGKMEYKPKLNIKEKNILEQIESKSKEQLLQNIINKIKEIADEDNKNLNQVDNHKKLIYSNINIIGHHKSQALNIMKLKNGYIITFGKNSLFLYDKDFQLIETYEFKENILGAKIMKVDKEKAFIMVYSDINIIYIEINF